MAVKENWNVVFEAKFEAKNKNPRALQEIRDALFEIPNLRNDASHDEEADEPFSKEQKDRFFELVVRILRAVGTAEAERLRIDIMRVVEKMVPIKVAAIYVEQAASIRPSEIRPITSPETDDGVEPIPITRFEERNIFWPAEASEKHAIRLLHGVPASIFPGQHISRFGLGRIIFRETPELGSAIALKLVGDVLPLDRLEKLIKEVEHTTEIIDVKKKFILERLRSVPGSNSTLRLCAVVVVPFTDRQRTAYQLRLEVERIPVWRAS